jgi:tetratricopeptide (TPR) repeat protein
MRRTGYPGVSLLLILILAVSALPGFSQAPAAPAKQQQAKTQAEYDAYKALFDEKDPKKKAELGEKFIASPAFKESDFILNAHRMIITSYAADKNWAKVIEAADRAAALPNADNVLKGVAYGNAMIAAQNMNNVDKVLSYGDKVLSIDPNDVNTLMTLSAVIPAKLPADAAGKKTALDKAADYANKALALLAPLTAKASAQDKPQFVAAEGQVHATLGLIAYSRPDYQKSIQEYETAIKNTPKDDESYFYLALDYQALAAQASRDYQVAFKAWNDAKVAKADQPTIDDADARQQALAEDIKKYRDKALDEFGFATAIGGARAAQAKELLTKLWTQKNDNTDGLDQFIADKKKQLG